MICKQPMFTVIGMMVSNGRTFRCPPCLALCPTFAPSLQKSWRRPWARVKMHYIDKVYISVRISYDNIMIAAASLSHPCGQMQASVPRDPIQLIMKGLILIDEFSGSSCTVSRRIREKEVIQRLTSVPRTCARLRLHAATVRVWVDCKTSIIGGYVELCVF
jgi:hypothetical protein